MKDDLKIAREKRAEKEDRFEALVKLASGRELTKEEKAEMTSLEAELQTIETEIKNLEAIEARKAKIAARKIADEAGAQADQDSNR